MINLRIVIILAAVAVAAAACSTGPASGDVAVVKPVGEWKASRLGERTVDGPTLQFGDDGSASGSTGCNRFSTMATADGRGGLSFAPTAVTKMACMDGDRMSVETDFLEALSATRQARQEGGRLQLLGADGGVLIELQPGSGQP